MNLQLTSFPAQNGIWTQSFSVALAQLRDAGGGVLNVPAGTYSTGPIELFSNIELHLDAGATIKFLNDPAAFSLRPCLYEGRLEERPQPCLAAYNAKNVILSGSGMLDGCGDPWWSGFRAKTLPNNNARPYLLHFEDCDHLRLRGIQLWNSPAWTVHPLRCTDVVIEDISIKNPYHSPNTDGINPESCRDVRILNCRVDVGDDCITLKSGTEQTDHPLPCENIIVANCCLVHGHGGIVIGSEMSGGVRNVTVTNCVFTGTDRGIRVKTRRRRGGCVENLQLSNLVMERVFCPFVFNMYYCCGTTEADRWVWEKNPYPVNTDTPVYRNIHISGVTVRDATACAGFFYGLAESPIQNLSLSDCHIELASDATPEKPAMMGELEPMTTRGFFLRNVTGVQFSNVTVLGCNGSKFNMDDTVCHYSGQLKEIMEDE